MKFKQTELNFNSNQTELLDQNSYLDYYSLKFENVQYRSGYFVSGMYKISTHVFTPADSKATVFIMHGYFDHVGIMRNFIKACVFSKYAVVGFDLPGHGLSSGDKGAINDFSEYSHILFDFISHYAPYFKKPFHLQGFSTGGAAVIDYLLSYDSTIFDKIVLHAPLIKLQHSGFIKPAVLLSKLFVDYFPRRYGESSSDDEFNTFIKKDPLELNAISLRWLEALCKWSEKIPKFQKLNKKILVCQGKQDCVVDWKYNIKIIDQIFTNSKIIYFEKANHHMLNERKDIRNSVIEFTIDYLNFD